MNNCKNCKYLGFRINPYRREIYGENIGTEFCEECYEQNELDI